MLANFMIIMKPVLSLTKISKAKREPSTSICNIITIDNLLLIKSGKRIDV